MDKAAFRNPPKTYREVPFWSWNDTLDPEELRRQIGLMDEAGWGGFFMHSRVGLTTPYMGERWMACVKACVAEARRRGMGAWLYDEDKWPSGAAGGLNVAAYPEFRAQYLICKVDNRPAYVAERLATFAAREIEGILTDLRQEETPAIRDESDRLIQFYPQTMPLGAAWFNDYAYGSLLNPEAVRHFIGCTHEVYAGAVAEDFGGAIPGVFTDEPCFLFRVGHGVETHSAIPWDAAMPAEFQRRRGYDLLPRLPALFFDVGEFHAVRYDFWRTVSELFLENYSWQMRDWCAAHGLMYTGHYMAEDSLLSQIQWIGAAMPHYAAMHLPGVDKLDRSINAGAGTILTIKQLDSAVCQLGKPRALCENYGCAGQDFAHKGRKWIGDWAYVLGITLSNPHLALYSLRGERKRDYPQDLFFQQPWWPENRLIADYFARLSYTLSQGQRVVDIAVIHPLGSAWTVYRPDAAREVDELDQALDRLEMTLLGAQRDFHLVDEMLIEMEDGAPAGVTTDARGPRLDVGRMSYRLAIVPPSITLTPRLAQLLRDFAAAGGPIVALAPLPTRLQGRPAEAPVLPQTTRVVELAALPALLDALLPFDVRVAGHPAVWAHHRRVDDTDCYFLANIDYEQGCCARVQLRGSGALELWDAATGETRPLAAQQQNGIIETTLDFAPAGSYLLALRQGPASDAPAVPARRVDEISLASSWEAQLLGPNALTLDTPALRIGAGAFGAPLHILDAHAEAARAGVGAPFTLRYCIDADVCPPAPLYLALEQPQRFNLVVNGCPIPWDDAGWWIDPAFRKVDIGAAFRAGRNEIMVSGVFGRDTELESLYLVGDFGVSARRLGREGQLTGQIFDRYAPAFRLTDAPRRVGSLDAGGAPLVDLTAQGCPFFAGRVALRQRVHVRETAPRAILDIEAVRAAVVRVRVNGAEQGVAAWDPYRVDVTAGLRAGENLIELEVVGTLRNLLGPHHVAGGDPERTSPATFREKNQWTNDFILVPFGVGRATLSFFLT